MTSGGVEPREDVVARAKAALEKYEPVGASQFTDDRFIGLMRGLVPELVAEVERLRAARYWVYLGSKRDSGPFPSYDEADRERRHCIDGGTITARLNPQIYSIRTDGWEQR